MMIETDCMKETDFDIDEKVIIKLKYIKDNKSISLSDAQTVMTHAHSY